MEIIVIILGVFILLLQSKLDKNFSHGLGNNDKY